MFLLYWCKGILIVNTYYCEVPPWHVLWFPLASQPQQSCVSQTDRWPHKRLTVFYARLIWMVLVSEERAETAGLEHFAATSPLLQMHRLVQRTSNFRCYMRVNPTAMNGASWRRKFFILSAFLFSFCCFKSLQFSTGSDKLCNCFKLKALWRSSVCISACGCAHRNTSQLCFC